MKTAKLKNLIRCAAAVTACAAALGLAACSGSRAPELDDVRSEFEQLITASAEINDIFFGQGLPVYDRETSSGSGDAQYDEKTGNYYWEIQDEALGTVVKIFDSTSKKYSYYTKEYLKDGTSDYSDAGGYYTLTALKEYTEQKAEYVYDDSSPENYDYVRLDCQYQTVDSIKSAAEKVYSDAYLEAIYTMMFDGYSTGSEIIYARYMTDESGETDFFLKSNLFDPYFETQTTYDFSTMKIVKPSTASSVNVEISATGTYIDYETVEKAEGTYTRTLRFVNSGDGWRLDTPTY